MKTKMAGGGSGVSHWDDLQGVPNLFPSEWDMVSNKPANILTGTGDSGQVAIFADEGGLTGRAVKPMFGQVLDSTKAILLDNANWGLQNNEFFYPAKTPEELGLYPGLQLWNISAKYAYFVTNDRVCRFKKAQPRTPENVNVPGVDGSGQTYTQEVSVDASKVVINLEDKGSKSDFYQTVNIKLPAATVLNSRLPISVIFESDLSTVTTVNLLRSDDTVISALSVNDWCLVDSTGTNYLFKKL